MPWDKKTGARTPGRGWKNYTDLAMKLGVSIVTVRKYRSMDGFPMKGTLEEVENFVALNGLTPDEETLKHSKKTKTKQGEVDISLLSPAQAAHEKKLADIRKARAEADLKETEYQKARGTLIEVDQVKSLWQTTALGLQNNLLAIGSQLAQKCTPLLSDISKVGELERAITEEIRRVLLQCADAGVPTSADK